MPMGSWCNKILPSGFTFNSCIRRLSSLIAVNVSFAIIWKPSCMLSRHENVLRTQIAALNLVLKNSNMRQIQKSTFSVKLTRIPFQCVLKCLTKYFISSKNISDPPFQFEKIFWSPFWSEKKYLIPPIFRSPSPPGKKWHFPYSASKSDSPHRRPQVLTTADMV